MKTLTYEDQYVDCLLFLGVDEPSVCVFANFYIDNEERLQRMKTSFESFRDIEPDEWKINIRGRLKEEAGLFLKGALSGQLSLNYLNSKKGWFYDSQEIIKDCQSDYVLFWIEDHVCLVAPETIKEVINEMRALKVDLCKYSFLHEQQNEVFQIISPVYTGKQINVWNISKLSARIIQSALDRDFYITPSVCITQRDFFLKVLRSKKPFLSRWPIYYPFDFEKKYNDGFVNEIKIALPKLEIFACIDDDFGVDGYSLISRGLYTSSMSRAQMKELDFPRTYIFSTNFFAESKNLQYSKVKLLLVPPITFFKRLKYTFDKFKQLLI